MNIPELSYGCVHCGYSCQGLEAELSRAEYETILGTVDPAAVVQRDERYWLRKKGCGSCHFLLPEGAEGRCDLHRRHGLEAKPRPCREFPFRAVETPGGVYLGASFACRAIATGQGPALREQSFSLSPRGLPEYPLAPGLEFDWSRYAEWESRALALLSQQGPAGLWSAPLSITMELLGVPPAPPTPFLEQELQAAFRGLLALAEGPMDREPLMRFLQAHAERGSYSSQVLGCRVDIDAVLRRWEEPWSLWPEVAAFFEHLLFRKYLLEGPDVHSRLCSLPLLAQILQFLVHARRPVGAGREDALWALRVLEERLTFHARGLENYLGRCGRAFLEGIALGGGN